jgi:hypothetical protein
MTWRMLLHPVTDRVKKLDRPVLTTGCRQQDFCFFKDDWRRYATSADTQRKIEKAAVEKQSNLLKKVKLMDSRQERDKQVRTIVARLRGLANICILFTDCTSKTCNKTVSHVNTPILRAFVKGLVDLDTNGGFG